MAGREPMVGREQIVEAIVKALEPLPYVHAFYEGGAIAHGRFDQWSDIDGYAVADDDKLEETMEAIRDALRSASPIEKEFVPEQHWPGLMHRFFRLERATEFLAIDMAVIKLSSDEKFLEPEVHGESVFHFNKGGRVKAKPFDTNAHAKAVDARRERVIERFHIFNCFVQKEINRRHWIEAVDLYQRATLGSLLELLRMRYHPLHYDFATRYVHDELPEPVVERFSELMFVSSPDDLVRKYAEATDWFLAESGQVNE